MDNKKIDEKKDVKKVKPVITVIKHSEIGKSTLTVGGCHCSA